MDYAVTKPFCVLLGAVLAIPLLAGPAGAQQPPGRAGWELPETAVRQIEALLAAKAQRTAAQRKVSSQLLDATESAQLPETATPRQPAPEGIAQQLRGPAAAAGQQAGNPDGAPEPERVTVDIRADVTPAVLARIRTLGGTVIDSVPKYRAIRAQLPLGSVARLAALDLVQSIRPADEAVTRKDDTAEGDVAHRAKPARTAHGVDGTGIGIGVISNGVRTLADRQASGNLPARVTVLPGQEGSGDEGTALLEIVHDLAPKAELYFATGFGGQARMAENIEALCEAGANVIVDDIGYTLETAFQDDIIAQGVNAAVNDGCYFFSAGGNDGNLTDGTTGVWEGDYAAGASLIVDGETLGVRHDFGGGVEANEVSGSGVSAIVLQWADPLGASASDYDLFLVNEDGDVIASSTDIQDGTQDPIESILSRFLSFSGLSVVVVKASGSDRYLRVHAFGGRLGIQTAGNLYGHAAAENAVSVAMVDVRTAAGSGKVFNGTESVRTDNSDGPRRIFFQPDGTPITTGNFSSTGGKLLQKPDLTAATCVTTATPGFSTFCGTSAAAPHAAAIAALMLEAAGGPDRVTLAQLRTGMTSGTAVLDIEANGVDRDSGAGIVMALGAVDAVDVVVADRNRAPTVESAQSNRTFAPGDDAVDIDLANVFDDPDDNLLTYEVVSSDPDRLAITRNGSVVTLTPGSPGRAVVVTLRAIDPDGLSAADSFSVTVTAGSRDYDADNNGLIDVASLAQLDALRYDLNADGLVDGATWMPYYTAYPMGALRMGCPSDGCTGYELTTNLDFDTDDDGDVDSNDDYWNGGDGWAPIGEADAPFTADFNGNRRTVSNLFIDRDTEDEVGLFGAIDRSRISGVSLIGAKVTGRNAVGSLLGDGVYPTVIDNHATGQVSGEDEVGGLVGRTWGSVWYSSAAVNVSGEDAVGGLVGHQTLNNTVASYATGNVAGMDAVGGLIGAVSDVTQVIEASYATGNVSGSGARLTDSDSGFIICDLGGAFSLTGPVETTTSTGGGVGGLVGSSCGWIQVSYATGAVSGTAAVGGLVGSGRFAKGQSSYWDVETSGVRVGVGEDDANDNGVIDGTERLRLGVGGKTTAELQTPADYTGIYEAWNVGLGSSSFGDGDLDDPWDFGTTAQYPVLSLDLNDDNRATWEEFGYQVRGSVTLTAATTASQAQVVLSWNAISTSSWSPAPDVSYTLYRDDGTTIEAIETDLTGITHTDTDVMIGDPYTYWVAAVVDGGEAARSAPVSVSAGGANQPPVSVGIITDRQLTVGSMAVVVDVAAAFQDPESDTLTYGASSPVTSVATLSRLGSMLTITPVAAGRTIITVTATDAGGSNTSASQRFRVTVGQDYDSDRDGLIGVSNLVQLDAMRYDRDGNGYAGTVAAYAAAFPSPLDRMGCGVDGCSGYELLADLDFDTDGDGAVDSDDDYWNDGDGWEPIGWDSRGFSRFFNAAFDGNEHTLSNLFTAGRGFSGLFGRIGLGGVVNGLTLSDVNVTGTEAAGALVGENRGLLSGIQSSGQVSGELHVGGLVGLNLRLVYLSRSSAAVTGMRPPLPPGTGLVDTFWPPAATGGLVGYNTGFVVLSYATGPVTSDRSAGGLVGDHQNKLIAASYATGPVTSPGSTAGGLVGTIATPFTEATIRASYATGTVSGTIVGGLVGHVYDEGIITASYATGRVDGRNEGGLVGDDEGGTITNSYWDTRTSGQGSGSPGSGRTTSQLQSPTGYSGIYGSWNLDIDEDNMNDNLWNFGTSSQYPALKADMDGDHDETWEEFGYQLRSGPTLTATATTNAGQSQVELEWTAVPLSSEWTPAPSLSYTVTREDDDSIEIIAENLTAREYTDTDVAGEIYIYQVVAVVDGGEAVRSATVSVTVAGNKRPMAVGTLRSRTLLVGDSAMTEVGGAFQDPEGDTITYGVSSSDTTVARVTLSGSRVTIIPVAEGRATITVTATDDGSNRSRTQQFRVTVRPTTTVDYDTDDDGLIEISNLAQLDAVRHNLNGSGSSYSTPYAEAFPVGGNVLACGGLLGCVGYELNDDLDFDTDTSGEADAGDTYWNNGAGWVPIGDASSSSSSFAAIFEGNGRSITNLFIDSSGNDIGLFGATRSSAVIRNLEMVGVQVTGTDNVGGLVGSNGGAVSACYATGKVSGDDDVGGLVGANLDDGAVSASYSTVQVTGDDRIGGLAGSNSGEVTAAYATGRVVGDSETGGLIGGNTGDVNISYATALVSGRSTVGGLVGRNSGGGNITGSYWDSDTSGRNSGSYGQAKNTEELQLPTAASVIYQTWNVDLDGDSMNDDPWDFGTSSHYPALSVDMNGVGGATWQEFGQQIRTSPALMPTTALGQVTLTWSAVSSAAYNLYRTSGTTVEILSENTSSRSYVDTDVTAGATYVYQVAAVINGGEASRSPRVSVVVPTPGLMPSVTLQLMPTSIDENGGSATVTARLSHTSGETTTVTVSATAVSPAVSGDFTLSMNKTLTIGAGQAASTGTVTITANNNGVDAPNKTVMVMGTATNSEGVTGPSDMTLTIRDDDAAPAVTTCSGGMAGTYPCRNVDLMSFLALADIGGGSANDVWGWTDSSTGKEYAIMGRTNGTSFVDISDPVNPIYLGNLPPHSDDSTGRDIKVYADHAFIVTEANNSGMQVFDLTQLRMVASPPATFSETAHYPDVSDAHNLAINEESGFAYAVGTNTCSGGLHMINIQTPTNPTSAGCFSGDGYTHDAQCVIYDGPDLDHKRKEICFNSNEDTLTIVDVTNKAGPVMLSRTGYSGSRYAHQGWLTEDQVYFLLGDELDEANNPDVTNTRTYMWDVSDLDDPALIGSHDSTTTAIDHNQYVKGNYTYQSNYQAGLRILDITDIANGNLSEAAFFDVNPGSDPTNTDGGTWSNYPFFDSGIVIVSVIEQGLFILRPNLVDGVNPALSSASVNGAALTLTYGEALDEGSRPAPGDFTVQVDGSGRSVSGVSVSGKVVTLTLASVVAHDETVTVSYSPGANPIRDAAGNGAIGLSNEPVANETPETALPNMWLNPTKSDPVASVRSEATYTVTFQGAWNTTVTSGGVPSGAHFTTLIGGVHNAEVTFLKEGGMATAGVEIMAELGGTGTLTNEVRAAEPNALSVLQGSAGNIGPTGSSTINMVTLTTDHPRVTLLSMVAPSPDWFVGVSGLSLLDAGADWLPSQTVNLYPWDAGTEEGTEFSLTNSATSPQETITSLRGIGKFSNERIATLTFTRQSVNTAPSFTGDTRFEADENQTATGRLAAADPDRGDGVTYAITGGADASKFDIGETTGVLTFQVPPNYERAADVASADPVNGAGNNEYIVTVTATGGTGDRAMTTEQTITATVRNVEEAGTISFSPVGSAIRARLSDPDGGVNGATWQWARSSNRNTGWTHIGGATSARYTPSSGDQGMYLQATVSYDDAHSSGKQAQGISATQIAPPNLRVATLVSGLSIPWDIAFTPDGTMLFTQRAGVLSSRLADGTVQTIDADFGDLFASGETGLMGIVVDPAFVSNRRFYTCQGHTGPEIQVIAWTLNAAYTQATRVADPLVGGMPASSDRHGGCRLRFGPEGYLWIATGDAASGTLPQDLTSLGGKVLRVDASTGAGAPTNPFAPSRVYTYGHRNVQGLALRPGTSQMWSVEHGPSVDDEINRLVAGRNYGWNPVPGYNESVPMTDLVEYPDAVEAKWSSGSKTRATSGGIFLEGNQWGVWEGRLAVATLADSKLRLFEFTPDGAFVSQLIVPELNGVFGRLRTPMMGPDGALYVSTSNGGSSDRILRIAEDDPIPVTLKLTPSSIGENGGVSTVTASQNRVSITATTVTVSAMAVNPAVPGDFRLSANKTLTITAGQTSSNGTVTLTANNNTADTPNKTVRVSGTATNSAGVTGPSDVTLTIIDDDDPPTTTLDLMPTSIGENGGSTTVTARLNRTSSETTTVTVSATAVSPAVSGDFRLSSNKTLTITAGQTSSSGTVTLTANNNDADTPNKTVRVSGTATNSAGVTGPSDVTLTITDDDAAPVMTLEVNPTVIAEAAGNSTVTVRINNGVAFAEDQQIALTFTGTASKGTDYTVGLERLTLIAGQSSTATTVTAVDDALDDEAETVRVTARHRGGVLGAEQTITITDDDAFPVILTNSPILVDENETAVATLTASDADLPAEDLMWRITGGADRIRFTLTADGVLTFAAPQDYEAPDDSDGNGDYEVTVEVSDGTNPVEAGFTIRLEDVDDTAPALSSASVNGATLTLTYDEALDEGSRPAPGDFTVQVDGSGRSVSGVLISGSVVTLTLNPAVEHGDTGIQVSYTPGTNPIQDAAGNDAWGWSSEAVTNETPDTTSPTVSKVEISSDPGSDRTYVAEDEIQVTVTFSETVEVEGTPRLRLRVGSRTRTADYLRGADSAALVFGYDVAEGDEDTDGVSIEAGRIALNGGTIKDEADNNAVRLHGAVAPQAGHKVDGVRPAFLSAAVDGASLTLTYDEALDGGSRPVSGASRTRRATTRWD